MSRDQISIKVLISWDRNISQYTAVAPELSLASQGDTMEEAKGMLREALSMWLEALDGLNTLYSALLSLNWDEERIDFVVKNRKKGVGLFVFEYTIISIKDLSDLMKLYDW